MIRSPSNGNGSTDVGQDFTEVIRPLCDIEIKPIEEELEPPEEEQFGVRNPRKMLGPKLPPNARWRNIASPIFPIAIGARIVSKVRARRHRTSGKVPGKTA